MARGSASRFGVSSSALALAVCAVLLAASLPVVAATFTVNSTLDAVDANPGDGICETAPGNGICTLRAAIQETNATQGPNQIVLPAGTYTLTIAGFEGLGVFKAAKGDLDITNDLTISGAGADTTIVDGNRIDRVFHVDPVPTGISVTISGVTIQNGASPLISFASADGGGILLGTPATIQCCAPSGSLTLIDSVVRNNTTPRDGGGIANHAGTLTLIGTVVTGNAAGNGGGIANGDLGTLVLSDSTLSDNLADQGGGLFTGYIDISTNGTNVTIVNSTVSGNTSGEGPGTGFGAGIYRNRGTLSLTNCTISGNVSFYGGGGLYDSGANMAVTVRNCTIAGNQAGTSGAGGFGGGIAGGPVVNVGNTIIAGNTLVGGPSDCSGTPTSSGYNLVQSTCGFSGVLTGNISGQNAKLGVLADNGGATKTQALLSGSPAIDAGNPATPGSAAAACTAVDQRGFLRPRGKACDIGAFEQASGLSVSGAQPSSGGNAGAIEALVYGSGFETGATVSLHRAGQQDVPASPAMLDDGGSVIAATFDLTGKATGAWDIVVANPDGTTASRTGAFSIVNANDQQVWIDFVGPSSIRVGWSNSYIVLFGNRGTADAFGVPIGLELPSHFSYLLQFPITPPPPQTGQLFADWSSAPVEADTGAQSGYAYIPLLLPIVPAGYTGFLEITLGSPPGSQPGSTFFDYTLLEPSLMNPGLSTSTLAGLVQGAQAYAQNVLGFTIPSTAVPATQQYVQNQYAFTLEDCRTVLLETFGARPCVSSLAQLTMDAAIFGLSQTTAPMSAPPSGGLAPKSATAPSYSSMQAPAASFARSPPPLAAARLPRNPAPPATPASLPDPLRECPIIRCGSAIIPAGCFCVLCQPDKNNNTRCADDPGLPPLPIPPDCPIGGKIDLPALLKLLSGDACKPTRAQCESLPNHHVHMLDDGTLVCVPDSLSGHCPKLSIPNPVGVGNGDCLVLPIKEFFTKDPNEKVGPIGVSDAHFLVSGNPLDYSIHFENQATATASVQQVVVTDQLDPNLDFSTFSLTAVSFGNVTVPISPGTTHYTGGVDLRPGQNILVKIDAALDAGTGIVTWRLNALDPDTLELTHDPLSGFLPPDTNPPAGAGGVLYTVRPKSGLATGTTICNQASIVFDTNAPIPTPQWCNTIDNSSPTSRVTALAPTQTSTSFPLQWAGSDTGSGIAGYSVFASDNGGPFNLFVGSTSQTSATFIGQVGHTYGFYSLASDLVGNAEAPKTAAEATTQIGSAPACATDVSPQVQVTRGGFGYNFATGRFAQTVTLKNTSASAITGPLSLVLDSLSGNATLFNPSGTTSCAAPAGSPFINLAGGLTPGASAALALQFTDPNRTGITYATRVLAGSAGR